MTVGRVENGVVTGRLSRPVLAHEQEEAVLDQVFAAIAELFDEEIRGVGCGVPSVVDVATGVLHDVENIPAWHRVPLKDRLERRFGVPVEINNDANVFALGEHFYGRGRDFENLVGLTLGTGMGTGVIANGRLFAGNNCGVGEIGSIPHKGLTIEDYCSGRFFRREAGMSGEAVFERATSGDAAAREWFDRFGEELAFAVVVALYAYDPDAILFGGSISTAFDLFAASMWQGLDVFDYPHILERLVIERSTLADAAVLGAAALVSVSFRDEAGDAEDHPSGRTK